MFDSLLAKTPSIIYQPGGVASKLTVTTWAAVLAFIAARQGAVAIFIDSSIAPANVGPGVTDCQGRVSFASTSGNVAGASTLTLPDGAVLRNPYCLSELLTIVAQGTTAPNIQLANGGTLILEKGATLINNGSQPCVRVAANEQAFIAFTTGATFTPSPGPLVDLPVAPAQFSLAMVAQGHVTGNNVITGVVGTDFGYNSDAGGGPVPSNPGFFGTTTPRLTDNASLVAYNPSTPANWPVPVPVQVAEALDDLANRIVTGVTLTFNVTTPDIFNSIGNPQTGTRRVRFQGCGGGGAGAGGGGGAGNAPGFNAGGAGGGAGGGASFQAAEVDIDLSHRIDVVIGNGGVGGALGVGGGAVGDGGSGTSGSDGEASYIVDVATGIVLASFSGASGGGAGLGGQGGGGPFVIGGNGGGTTISGAQIVDSNAGFPSAGGEGGSAATAGTNGNAGLVGIGMALGGGGPNAGLFPGGIGGTSGGTIEGGGGGGGGAGPFGPGAAGGDGPDGAGTPGADATPNTGAGGGGGGGGESTVSTPPGGQPGAPGGVGGSGRIIGHYGA